MGPIFDSVRKTGRLLVVQESGETAGLGDRFVSLVMQQCFGALTCAPRLVSAPDIPVPFAPELEIHYRPQVKTIVSNLNTLIGDA
jgi:pyruvate/2-oxoglutarate/acetoin dehydrogenase E1 component